MTPECEKGGGGRNAGSLVKRIAAATIFLPCFFIIAHRGGIYYLILIDLIIVVGLFEFYKMTETKGLRPYKWIGILSGGALPWYLFFRQGMYANVLLTLTFMAVMIAELVRKDKGHAIYHISVTIFGVLYVSWLGSHLMLLRELPVIAHLDYRVGFNFVLLLFALTWCYDTGAYTFGRLFGRRKLFPSISPGKTVEGMLGGTFLSIAGVLAVQTLFETRLTVLEAVLLATAGSIIGQIGDLVESMIKRDVRIKDSSAAIPGHGGALDRFDSLLFTAPLVYYTLRYFVLEV
jgi:phosphatidate cytidylyltransferase